MFATNPKIELEKIATRLPKGARAIWIFEGEQVTAEEALKDGFLFIREGQWRPEGESLPVGVEAIPGYRRPENWKTLQARNSALPGEIVLNGQTWRMPQ